VPGSSLSSRHVSGEIRIGLGQKGIALEIRPGQLGDPAIKLAWTIDLERRSTLILFTID
jgi:hypothetical protein